MYKNKLLLLLAWMLVVNANAQIQLTKWPLYGQNVTFSTNPAIAPIVSNDGLPTTFKAKNSIYDSKGRMLFYVGDWNIYDGFGKVVSTFDPISPATEHYLEFNCEYPIVPCIETSNSCIKNYYVFYSVMKKNGISGQMSLFAKIVSVDGVNGNVTVMDVKDASGNRRTLATSIPSSIPGSTTSSFAHGGQAVSKLINNKRYLYWVAGKVMKITLTDLNGSNNGISAPSTIFDISNNSLFEFGTLEADLSHDGSRLIWGTVASGSIHKYFMIGLTPSDGNWDNSINSIFQLTTNSVNATPLRGVEFSQDGASLYVTTGGSSGNHGIYWKSIGLTPGPFNYIAGTSIYGASQLEYAKNGLIYATSAYGCIGINLTTHLAELSGNIPVGTALTYGNYYCLPDQIDGENYENTPFDYYDIKDLSMAETPSQSPVKYSQTDNPFNISGNDIKVAGTLSFIANSASTISKYEFHKMRFSMAQDAKIIIGNNMELWLYGCSFKSSDCAGMWKGFEVIGTGKIILVPGPWPTSEPNYIYDAQIGISVSGGNAQLSVSNTIFNRNITHLKIMDYKPYNITGLDIQSNKFLHTQYLRIFEPGQQFPVVIQYGTTSIDLGGNNNAALPTLLLNGNLFEGGTYGINSTGVPFRVVYSNPSNDFINFTQNNSVAIRIDMKDKKGTVTVQNVNFKNVNQALYATGKTNIDFSNNIVDKVKTHAVMLYKNNNCELTLNGNKFYNFPLSAILLNSNVGTNGAANTTKIKIALNIFDNTAYLSSLTAYNKHLPTAITIDEAGQTSKQNFKEMRITQNIMTNIAYGIKVTNVKGYQVMNKRYNKPDGTSRTDISDIDNNTINVYTTYVAPDNLSDYNSGIQLNQSNGLRIAVNTINNTNPTIWRNRGVHSINTEQSLFYKNKITAGRGIAGEFRGYGNDINCNEFKNVVNGISLKDYSMRTKGTTHGVPNMESRDNYFTSTAAEDIELYLFDVSNPANPQNATQLVERNQWIMTTSPDVYLQPSPGAPPYLKYIKSTLTAPNFCTDEIIIIEPGDGENSPKFDPSYLMPDNKMDAWQEWYNYERQLKANGQKNNPFMNRLIDLEQQITSGDDKAAFGVLRDMSASDDVYAQNYITVYTILLSARLQDERTLDTTEKSTLISIASQKPYEAGPSIFTARAILWQYEGLSFVDTEDRPLALRLKLDQLPCITDLPKTIGIQLKDDNGQVYSTDEVPILQMADGYVYITADVLAKLSDNMKYTFVFTDGKYAQQPYKNLDDWMQDNILYMCHQSYNNSGENSNTNPMQAEALAINIYPNPAYGQVTMQLPLGNEYDIQITDILGNRVYNGAHNGDVLLTVNNYLPGVYIVSITNKTTGVTHQKQLVITK